jgi:hypothetical protein
MREIVMSLRKKEFDEFLSNIEDCIGTTPEDLDMLKWIIEDTYDEKFKVNLDYFDGNQELLISSNLELYEELNTILRKLVSLEQYEKCAVIKSCIDSFILAFKFK